MNMKLNHESESLVESEYTRAAQEISSKHYQAIRQFEQAMPRGGAMRAAIDNERIQMAKELVHTMLKIYLEAFRRENVIPDDSYVASIYSKLENIVDNISRSSRPPHLPSSLEKYRSIAPSAGQDLVLAVKKMRLEHQRSESRDSDGLHITIGDTYNIIGQSGSVGPNAQAVGNTFNQGAGIASGPALSPMQERLLQIVADRLRTSGASKLVVGRRDGALHFDDDPARGKGLSLITDLWGISASSRGAEFEQLVESMPSEYFRLLPETRYDNPFVIMITNEGIYYLRERRLAPVLHSGTD
jgi:hypothetical protein